MVVHRTCSFCAGEIEPGTGQLFVKRDGSLFAFCSSSCRKQQMDLGRVGHRLRWTRAHELKRLAEQRRQPTAPEAPATKPATGKTKGGPAKPAKAGPAKKSPTKKSGDETPVATKDADETPKKPRAKKPAPTPPAEEAPS
jgi:large subunit ribosomal protein L24e